MIQAILTGVFKLVTNLVSVILLPIDTVISQFLPSVNYALGQINSLLVWLGDCASWVWSWFGLNANVTALVVGYLVFKYTVPFTIHTVKLAIQWYDKLKV